MKLRTTRKVSVKDFLVLLFTGYIFLNFIIDIFVITIIVVAVVVVVLLLLIVNIYYHLSRYFSYQFIIYYIWNNMWNAICDI